MHSATNGNTADSAPSTAMPSAQPATLPPLSLSGASSGAAGEKDIETLISNLMSLGGKSFHIGDMKDENKRIRVIRDIMISDIPADKMNIVIDKLLLGFKKDTISVKAVALEALKRFDPNGRDDVIDALLKEMWFSDRDKTNHNVASIAKDGLIFFGKKNNAKTMAGLIAKLKDPSSFTRCHAAEALGQIGNKSDAVIDALCAALSTNLNNKEWDVQRDVIYALQTLKPTKASILDKLQRLTHHKTPTVSKAATDALASLKATDDAKHEVALAKQKAEEEARLKAEREAKEKSEREAREAKEAEAAPQPAPIPPPPAVPIIPVALVISPVISPVFSAGASPTAPAAASSLNPVSGVPGTLFHSPSDSSAAAQSAQKGGGPAAANARDLSAQGNGVGVAASAAVKVDVPIEIGTSKKTGTTETTNEQTMSGDGNTNSNNKSINITCCTML